MHQSTFGVNQFCIPTITYIPFKENDGGRKEAGYIGVTGDCVTRAIAIASELPYQEVYDAMAHGNFTQRKSKRDTKKRSRTARDGISTKRKWFKDYMASIGFKWTPTMQIGSGCKVHLRPDELPKGRLIVNVSKHYTTMIDGVINDLYNPSREGTRCVYGYWSK
tara:strand:+ start:5548 stop:6039 length:492 start_codon:yes stop_codon:yes gene_type:complete